MIHTTSKANADQSGAHSAGIISVDDHVVEPPSLWTDRLPARLRDGAPSVKRIPVADLPHCDPANTARWVDVWHYEDARYPLGVGETAAGRPSEETTVGYTTYDEIRPGCFQVDARLEDMDLNGVDVSLCFPNMFVRFCGQRFLHAQDKTLALECVRAYNDWMIEDWAGRSHGRLIANAIIPLWSPEFAAAEVRRIATADCRSVCFSELPTRLGLPSLYSGKWDPFLAACDETATLINIHIGSSSTVATSSEDAPYGVSVSNTYTSSSLAMTDWILSGVLERYPNIRISFAEAQAGWIPYLLERLDNMWTNGNQFDEVRTRCPEPPSTYFRRHIYACIFDDLTALRHLDLLGNNLCFETDYPHADTTWPDSCAVAEKHLATVSRQQADKVLRRNAMNMLHLDGFST